MQKPQHVSLFFPNALLCSLSDALIILVTGIGTRYSTITDDGVPHRHSHLYSEFYSVFICRFAIGTHKSNRDFLDGIVP